MISLKLTRWLMGYVRFSVVRGNMERFLNQCARSGIYLWDMRSGPNCGACTVAGQYRALRFCARRTHCRLKVKKRYGFPFVTAGFRKRRGLVVGGILFIVMIGVLSMHVWCIDVVGNTSIPAEDIKQELSNLGVHLGTQKSKIDSQIIQQQLMLKFPQVSWLSVNTRGCTTEIRLQEKTERPPLIVKDTRPCNIKASATGQIISLEVYTGIAQVHKGDAVVEGQLLISGIVEDEKGATFLKHAAGKIIAETSHSFTMEVERKRSVVRPTGRTVSQRALHFFGAKVPLTLSTKPSGNYRPEGVYTSIKLMNCILPVGLYETNWIEEESVSVMLTKEQAVEEAKKMLENKIKEELPNAKVISVSASDQMKDSKLFYTATVKCEENIVKESEILI